MSEYGDTEPALVPGTLRGYRGWFGQRISSLSGLTWHPHQMGTGERLIAGSRTVPTLMAMNYQYRWLPGVNTARCMAAEMNMSRLPFNISTLPVRHPAPARVCQCGFYATYSPLDYPNAHQAPSPSGNNIIGGAIKASGRIILGTRGFRAETVEIEALYGPRCKILWVSHPQPDKCTRDTELTGHFVLADYANAYQVPLYPDLASMLADFPPPDVTDLINASQVVPSEDGV